MIVLFGCIGGLFGFVRAFIGLDCCLIIVWFYYCDCFGFVV